MRVIVSDTSPISALFRLDCLEIGFRISDRLMELVLKEAGEAK